LVRVRIAVAFAILYIHVLARGLADNGGSAFELGVAGLCVTLFSEQILESVFNGFKVSESPGRATLFSGIEDGESVFAIKNSVVCVHGLSPYMVKKFALCAGIRYLRHTHAVL
jgi:hypothetical protein